MNKIVSWFSLALIATTCSYAASAAQTARDPKYDRLAAGLDTLTMDVSVTPVAAPAIPERGLISGLLYVSDSLEIEPHLQRNDGSFVTGAARISKESMLRALDVLDRGGFLATAETFYSERTAKPKGPPPASKHIGTHLDLGQTAQTAELKLTVFDENYYTIYIVRPSWDKQLAPLLTDLQRTITEPAAKTLLTQLLETSSVKGPEKK